MKHYSMIDKTILIYDQSLVHLNKTLFLLMRSAENKITQFTQWPKEKNKKKEPKERNESKHMSQPEFLDNDNQQADWRPGEDSKPDATL